MMKKLAVAVLSIIFVMTILGGVWSMTYSQPRSGFSDSDYFKPMASGGFSMDPVPSDSGTIHTSPDISILFSLGHFYRDYGSVIEVTASNDGRREVFLIAFAFEWMDTGQRFEKYVNQTIGQDQTRDLGLLNIEGTGSTGEQEYRMLVKILEKRNGIWYKLEVGSDDWVPFESSTITVIDEVQKNDYDYQINYHLYFDRANELVTPDSPSITYQASIATTHLGPGYKVSKIAAIFDYVDGMLTYRLEPEGVDEWQSPEECLSTKTGDCEDYSLLIAAMVKEIGGTPRIYLIDGHAFAAVYAGDTTSDLENAEESIAAYYNADLKIYYLHDETGYWMIADPLGSFYFGGSSVGSAPISGGEDWEWTFNETDVVHAIDITGEVPKTPLWYNVVFWMYMMFITGTSLIIMTSYWARKDEKAAKGQSICANCKTHIPENQISTSCPNCGSRMHNHCLVNGRYCPMCNNMVFPPPQPPIQPAQTTQPVSSTSPPPPPPAPPNQPQQ